MVVFSRFFFLLFVTFHFLSSVLGVHILYIHCIGILLLKRNWLRLVASTLVQVPILMWSKERMNKKGKKVSKIYCRFISFRCVYLYYSIVFFALIFIKALFDSIHINIVSILMAIYAISIVCNIFCIRKWENGKKLGIYIWVIVVSRIVRAF